MRIYYPIFMALSQRKNSDIMKKSLLLLSTVCLFAIANLSAQQAESTTQDVVVEYADAAEKAAAMDANIERKVCGTSGKVCYVRSSTNAETGEVVKTQVKYDETTGKFVDCAKKCSAAEKKACGMKSTTSASATQKPTATAGVVKVASEPVPADAPANAELVQPVNTAPSAAPATPAKKSCSSKKGKKCCAKKKAATSSIN